MYREIASKIGLLRLKSGVQEFIRQRRATTKRNSVYFWQVSATSQTYQALAEVELIYISIPIAKKPG